VILGVPERPRPRLGGAGQFVVVDRVGQLGEFVGGLGLPVGGGRVHEHDVQIKIQEMGDRAEHLGGDLLEGVEQEVHRRVRGVIGEPRAARDRDPLGHPAGRGQLRPGLARPLAVQREHHPLHRVAVQAPPGGDPADRRADPETFPDPVQPPRRTQPAGVQDRRPPRSR
jgi:hypothetical protein